MLLLHDAESDRVAAGRGRYHKRGGTLGGEPWTAGEVDVKNIFVVSSGLIARFPAPAYAVIIPVMD
jgi:hypothetical protein